LFPSLAQDLVIGNKFKIQSNKNKELTEYRIIYFPQKIAFRVLTLKIEHSILCFLCTYLKSNAQFQTLPNVIIHFDIHV
jgi:hypothetical protein